jgi:hypothetical protein
MTTTPDLYADPQNPALPKADMQLNVARAALVVVDPQVDAMSPKGVAWPVEGRPQRRRDEDRSKWQTNNSRL